MTIAGAAIGALGAGGLAAAAWRSHRPADEPQGPGAWTAAANPPGLLNGHKAAGRVDADGSLRGEYDPFGWFNAVKLRGEVRGERIDVRADPAGASNHLDLHLRRHGDRWRGELDPPGGWNGARVNVRVARDGRSWRGEVDGSGRSGARIAGRRDAETATWQVTVDPRGWRNTTEIRMRGEASLGAQLALVSAAIARGGLGEA